MISYYRQTSRGSEIEQLDAYKAGSWVYVEDPTNDELVDLVKQHSLDEGHIEDALDIDEVPRVEREDELTYVFTRLPYEDNALQVSTIPVLFIVGAKTLITISRVRLPIINQPAHMQNVITTQPVNSLLLILESIVENYERKLTGISKQILSTRNKLRVQQIRNRDFVAFVTIEDTLNEYMSALLPNSTIMKRLLVGRYIVLDEDNRELIEDLLLSNDQSIEACKSNIKTIVSIREAYSTIATNNLNQVIRLLTSITVILTIPTIITSAFGMNVGGLPLADNTQAFWIIMGLSAGISGALLLLFKLNKWL